MKNRHNLKGIDNAFFTVLNLDKAVQYYTLLGFTKKIALPHMKAALLSIGKEQPGIILCEKNQISPSKLWIEVENAKDTQEYLQAHGIKGIMLEAATGMTFEVQDDSENIIGFADYTKKPELGR